MLRRFMCIFSAAALLLSLCACGDINIPFEPEPFTAQVTTRGTANEIKGELTYNSPEDITFKIKEPGNISGMEFTSASQSMDISVGEVSFTTDAGKDSPIYTLFGALEKLAASDVSIPLKGESEISFEYEGMTCRANINCEEKKITSMEAEKYSYIFE